MQRACFEDHGVEKFIAARSGVISIAVRDYIVG